MIKITCPKCKRKQGYLSHTKVVFQGRCWHGGCRVYFRIKSGTGIILTKKEAELK